MERYPDEWERFLADPYAHRAPRAESYHDLSGGSLVVLATGHFADHVSPSRASHI